MAIGLAALLDDIAALVKLTASSLDDIAAGVAKAGSKAIAVVVDDTAVTPQYVEGIDPKREIPIIKRIAKGSLLNKAIILVGALLLSSFAPWALTPLLMVGGTYLCFEGAHKIWGKVVGHHETQAAVTEGENAENAIAAATGTANTRHTTERRRDNRVPTAPPVALAAIAWERTELIFSVLLMHPVSSIHRPVTSSHSTALPVHMDSPG